MLSMRTVFSSAESKSADPDRNSVLSIENELRIDLTVEQILSTSDPRLQWHGTLP